MVVLVVCGRARLAVVLLLVVRISGQALDTGKGHISFTCEFWSNSNWKYLIHVKHLKRLRGDKKPLPISWKLLENLRKSNSKTSAGRVGRPPGAAADSTKMLFDVHGVSHRE